MSKLRVYQLASEYDVPSKEFVDILNKHNIPVKNHMSVLTEQQVTDFRKEYKKGEDTKEQPKAAPKAAAPKQEAKARKPQQSKQDNKSQPKGTTMHLRTAVRQMAREMGITARTSKREIPADRETTEAIITIVPIMPKARLCPITASQTAKIKTRKEIITIIISPLK